MEGGCAPPNPDLHAPPARGNLAFDSATPAASVTLARKRRRKRRRVTARTQTRPRAACARRGRDGGREGGLPPRPAANGPATSPPWPVPGAAPTALQDWSSHGDQWPPGDGGGRRTAGPHAAQRLPWLCSPCLPPGAPAAPGGQRPSRALGHDLPLCCSRCPVFPRKCQ